MISSKVTRAVVTSTPSKQPAATRHSDGRTRFSSFVRSLFEKYALLIAWAVMILGFALALGSTFFSVANFASSIFGAQAVLVVLTMSIVVTLTAGEFDLSVGGVLTLSAMLVAILNVKLGWPILLAVLAALIAGALMGALNGLIVLRFGVHSLITTLGTGTIASGIVFWISNSETISGVSDGLIEAVVVPRVLGLPLVFFYAVVLTTAVWYFLKFTATGRRMAFVGRDRKIGHLSGLRVNRLRWGALTGGGFLAALAGVFYVGTSGAADPSSGASLMLPAIAATFLGSTSINPGRFNAWGAFVAVYFLTTGVNGLALVGINTWVQNLFYGSALIVAVALSVGVRRREVVLKLDLSGD